METQDSYTPERQTWPSLEPIHQESLAGVSEQDSPGAAAEVTPFVSVSEQKAEPG